MKIAEFQNFLKKEKIDFALFSSNTSKQDSNINYFAEASVDSGILLIPNSSHPLFFVKKLEEGRMRKKLRNFEVSAPEKTFLEEIKSIFPNPKKIGINKDSFSISEYERLKNRFDSEIVDVSEFCNKLREIKNLKEINYISKSCLIAGRIMSECIKNFQQFETEADAKNFIQSSITEKHLKNAFEPIVASGKNASMPHHLSRRTRLQKGFCIIDLGMKHKEYCSDITRTIYLGNPSRAEIEAYNKLLEAQKLAISLSKPGAIASEIDSKTRTNLGSLQKLFIHSLGHQLGIDIHEKPFRLSKGCNDEVKNGMIFTIEPGIYKKNKFGIRIEDTVLINEKARVLTRYPKSFKYLKQK